MATHAKTNQGDLLALQSVAASSVVVGSARDVSTALGGMCYARIGRRSATAAGAVCQCCALRQATPLQAIIRGFHSPSYSGDFAACAEQKQ